MNEKNTLTESVGRITRMAAAALEETLSPRDGEKRDTKAARDLSGIMKDMLALGRELRAESAKESVTVSFEGGTEDAAR